MTLLEELQVRDSFYQVSSEKLGEYLEETPRTFYLGVDPTADSLHVGNLATLMVAKRFLDRGHELILVVGGATGMVGDPSGKSEERNLLDADMLAHNVQAITAQAKAFFGETNWKLVNNYDWTAPITLIDFLRDTGKHFSINAMLKKDSVANRLGEENFFSYTEFSYSLLQAYDFLHLFETENCTIQIGASDQWGNMLSGTELIHKKVGKDAYVFTAPLVVNSKTGKKFGKSETGTIWLDEQKTNSYELYQFFLNTPDEDAISFLKRFTTLSLDEVDAISKSFMENPSARQAQKTLAYEVVKMMHGVEKAAMARDLSEKLFSGEVSNLSGAEYEMLASVLPKAEVVENTEILDILVTLGLATSKREAREFVEQGAVTVQGEKVIDPAYIVPQNSYTLIRKGKKEYGLVIGKK